MIAAVLTVVCWSGSAVVSHRLALRMGGVAANFWRLLAAAVCLGLYAHIWGAGFAGPALPWLLASGVVGFGLGDVGLYQAFPQIGPRLTVLMAQCLAVPFGALLEWFWLGHVLSGGQMLAALAVVLGVVVALAPGSHEIPRGHLLAGIGWGLLAAAGQGAGAVLSVQARQVLEAAGQNMDGLSAAYQRIWGGVAIGALWLCFEVNRGRARWSGRSDGGAVGRRVGLVLITALAGPVVGAGFYQWALFSAPSGVVLSIVATTPLAVMPYQYFLEGERPGWRAVAGGVLAVGGVIALLRGG